MKTSNVYSAPGYVTAFNLAGLLCVLGGLGLLFLAVSNEESVVPAVATLIAGGVNFLYAQIADAVARTHWRVERLAEELLPAINEARISADERERRERAAAQAREEEIRRVLEQRQAGNGGSAL